MGLHGAWPFLRHRAVVVRSIAEDQVEAGIDARRALAHIARAKGEDRDLRLKRPEARTLSCAGHLDALGRRVTRTAIGRSGCAYTASVLTALGAPCGRGSVFQPATGGVSARFAWPAGWAGDATWAAAPALGQLPEGATVLHQVRNPIEVIRSLLRIEFFQQPSVELDYARGALPRNENTRGDRRRDAAVTWDSLPKGALLDELSEMAEAFGYAPGVMPQLRAS